LNEKPSKSGVELDVRMVGKMRLDKSGQLADCAHRLETKRTSKDDQVILALV
jgi:hypothetical protein